eukprot:11208468-Lingulodinium_polyedra.AAC.1
MQIHSPRKATPTAIARQPHPPPPAKPKQHPTSSQAALHQHASSASPAPPLPPSPTSQRPISM